MQVYRCQLPMNYMIQQMQCNMRICSQVTFVLVIPCCHQFFTVDTCHMTANPETTCANTLLCAQCMQQKRHKLYTIKYLVVILVILSRSLALPGEGSTLANKDTKICHASQEILSIVDNQSHSSKQSLLQQSDPQLVMHPVVGKVAQHPYHHQRAQQLQHSLGHSPVPY